jgi:predicted HicB family RNase H-like nuclease
MTRIPNYSYQAAWSEEDSGYIATCTELPTLSAYGESAAQAIVELQEAVTGALDILDQQGAAIPAARPLPSHSGQFRMRLPKSLHAQLARRAEDEGVSLNTLAVSFLSRSLACDVTVPIPHAAGRGSHPLAARNHSRRAAHASPASEPERHGAGVFESCDHPPAPSSS